jgi:KipI family sensor histidine kinase inhibitor
MELGHEISESTHKKIFTLITHLIHNPIQGIINIHPGYTSMLFTLDKMANIDDTIQAVENSLDMVQNSEPPEAKLVEVPVLYGGNYGKDIQRVVQFSRLSEDEIIQRHQSGNYLVYFLGFSPGFPYIGGMDQDLKTPRLQTPRKRVPQGSVAIAGGQTGIYPFPSPGGWNLIGRTPLKIFNISNPQNSLIQMGDKVQFKSISEDEYERLKESNGA